MAPEKKQEKDTVDPKTVVIAIAGASGSGKSTLVRNIADRLENSETMYFDDYRPQYENLTEDLGNLRKGNNIIYPVDNRRINAGKLIILEEPTGRTRRGMSDKIDFLVYINIPLEVSLARVLLRSILESGDKGINEFYNTIGPQFEPKFTEEQPTKLMHILVWQLEMYLKQHRQVYLVDHENNLKEADLVVDGLKPINQLTHEVIEKIRGIMARSFSS